MLAPLAAVAGAALLAPVATADGGLGGSPQPNASAWLLIIVAALGGGLLPVAVAAYRRWRRGPIEDEKVIGDIVQGQLGGMKDLLEEYRLEVEVTKRQLTDYREQLQDMTRELARAQVRITHLEDELRTAREGRGRLEAELERLVSERDGLASERERLSGEAQRLRERIDRLEQFAEDVRHPRATS